MTGAWARHHRRAGAISTVTTIAYLGFLVGPTVVGVASSIWSLSSALGGVAVLAIAMAALAPVAGRRTPDAREPSTELDEVPTGPARRRSPSGSTVGVVGMGYGIVVRLGVLDIGSNSAQLQIVEVHAGAPPLPRHAVKEPTRLAESFTPDGAIDPDGVERVATAVGRVMEAGRRLGMERLFAFATAAIRDASNRDEIIDRVAAESGVCPQFLSGEDEARLTYAAVHRWYGWSAGRLLVVDIGGGSMEIVLGRDAAPELAVSLPLSAGRLTRAFLPDDPPTSKQVKALRRHTRDTVREVSDRLHWEGAPARAIATSKTFKQLARLAGAPPQREGPFARRTLRSKDLARWVPRLAKMHAHERAKLRGVSAPRARQIVAGAVVAETVMGALGVTRVEVSPWALREGIMLHYLHDTTERTWTLPLQPVPGPSVIEQDQGNVLALPRPDGAG